MAVANNHLLHFLVRQHRQHTGKQALACLAASLTATYTFFLVGVDGSLNSDICRFAAVSVHYTLLSSFCWMSIQAVAIFLSIHKRMFKISTDVNVKWSALYAWGKNCNLDNELMAMNSNKHHHCCMRICLFKRSLSSCAVLSF